MSGKSSIESIPAPTSPAAALEAHVPGLESERGDGHDERQGRGRKQSQRQPLDARKLAAVDERDWGRPRHQEEQQEDRNQHARIHASSALSCS